MSIVAALVLSCGRWLEAAEVGILAGPIVNPANNHHYYLLEPATWTDSEAKAVAMNGHLVTVNDQEEHYWVSGTFSSYRGVGRALWIGLSDPTPWLPIDGGWAFEQRLIWSSGQPMDFFCWSTNPTNSSQGTGRIKMVEPDPSWPWGQCEWKEEADSTLLNGVAEIPLALTIRKQPQTMSVGIGCDVTLTVEAESPYPIQYQWQFMGTNFPGATRSSLTLSNAQPAHSGSYRVILSNSTEAIVSETAVLTVQGVIGWGWSGFGVFNMPPALTNIVAISAGTVHCLALKADGTVAAWGDNRAGITNVPANLANVTAIAAGDYFSLALKSDGAVVAWGAYAQGATDVPPGLTNVVALAAGAEHSLALRADGTVVGWGMQLETPAGLSNVVAIAAGDAHNLALRADGTVVAWGGYIWSTSEGWIKAYVPEGLSNIVAIAGGSTYSLALRADGTVLGWGYPSHGYTDIPPGLTNVVAIAAGDSHSVALTADGSIVEWGVLGADVPLPRKLPNVVAISASTSFSLALVGDGTPHFTVQPWDQSVIIGQTLRFDTKAVGFPVMHYQWQFNGNNISSATEATLTISGARMLDAGVYNVAIANQFGTSFSRQAKLAVVSDTNPPPVTASNHAPILLWQSDWTLFGQTALVVTNTASDNDLPPNVLTYQLVNYPTGAQIDANGIIRWTPSSAQVPSTNSFTTVVTDNGVPPLSATNTFQVFVVAPGVQLPTTHLLGWWPGDGNGDDVLGRNDALLLNGVGFDLGILAKAFAFSDAGDYFELPGDLLMSSSTLTLQMWVYPTQNAVTEMILTSCPGDSPGRGLKLALVKGLNDQLFLDATLVGMSNSVLKTTEARGQHPINLDQWTHVAMTLDSHMGIGLYVNGQWDGGGYFVFTPWSIFGESAGPWRVGGGLAPEFSGRIDELILYNDSLSPAQIASIYDATKPGMPLPPQIVSPPSSKTTGLGTTVVFAVKAASPGGIPLSYQWLFNGAELQGQTNASLTLTNLQLSDSGEFSVLVSSAAGVALSPAATLSVAGIVAWGQSNYEGQLDVPKALTNVLAISTGGAHTLALLANSTLTGWGSDIQNELHIPAGLSNVIAISAGENYSLALKSDGRVIGWGGVSSPGAFVPADLTNVLAISAAGYSAFAIRTDGTIVGWDGTGTKLLLPPEWTNVIQIAGAGLHSLALRADGTVVAWGDDSHGQADVPKDLTNVVAVSAHIFHSLALKSDGTVVAWGAKDYVSSLTNTPAGLSNVVAIAASEMFNLALQADGSVVEWGADEWGLSPRTLDLPNVVAISTGDEIGVALLRDGAPQITVQPWDQTAAAGGTSRFTAKAVGMQSIAYQWKFNGQAIPGATADSYAIPDAQSANSGLYHLVVSNQVGVISSRQAKLVVAPDLPGHTNTPPFLPLQNDLTIDELSELVVVNTVTNAGIPPSELRYQLINPPNRSSIDANGVIRWTPDEAQGPTSNLITTVVTDLANGLSATNTFVIVVREVNRAPILPAAPSRIISALGTLIVTNAATDPDLPANILTYKLVEAPTGALMDGNGTIHWTPAREQGPSTNRITTVVTDNGIPNLSATNSFQVIVSAPVLAAPANYTINPGQTIVFTNSAADNDPARKLTFTLLKGPKNAVLGSETGIFSFRPPITAAGTTNIIEISVTDDSTPALSDSRSFIVIVNPVEPVLLTPIAPTNRRFQFRITGTLGPDYVIEAGTELTSWTALQTNTPSSMPFYFSESNAPTSRRFYRVRLEP